MHGGRDEDALSEIVGFVLVLAMVVVASTLYLMYVVPAEGREDEITHMNKVQDRFVSYKTSVDGLWMRSLADISTSGTRGVSLSTSFDLGTGGGNTQSSGLFLSFMKPIGTAAKMRTQLNKTIYTTNDLIGLNVNGEEQFRYNYTDEYGDEFPSNFIPIGSLSYHTDNYYWIQQNYYYKLGGLFLEQPGEGVSVKIAPPIAIYQVTNETSGQPAVKVSLSLVNITSDDSTVGGTGPLRLETRLRESMSTPYRNEPVSGGVIVQIFSQDPIWLEAWRQVFIDATRKSSLSDPAELTSGGPWFHIWYPNPNIIELDIQHGDPAVSKDVFLDLSEATLQVTFEYEEP
jgi:hypothetical protein